MPATIENQDLVLNRVKHLVDCEPEYCGENCVFLSKRNGFYSCFFCTFCDNELKSTTVTRETEYLREKERVSSEFIQVVTGPPETIRETKTVTIEFQLRHELCKKAFKNLSGIIMIE